MVELLSGHVSSKLLRYMPGFMGIFNLFKGAGYAEISTLRFFGSGDAYGLRPAMCGHSLKEAVKAKGSAVKDSAEAFRCSDFYRLNRRRTYLSFNRECRPE